MKKLYPFLLVIATPVILLLMSNSTGSTGGKTGSIGDDGTTCTQCHTGTANTATNWITTDVPSEGYTPGETYTITATGTHAGVVKFGFELTVEDSQGNKVGTLLITDPTRTHFTNSNHAVTHTAAGNVPAGNMNSWSMDWVAPSNVQGNVGIYAAFNAANGNGSTGGDVIYKSSIFIAQYNPPPVLVSIVPNQAEQGTNVMTTITAENTMFGGSDPVVSLTHQANPNEIISATSVTVINNTTLHADFDIPYPATPGFWSVHVDDMILGDAFQVILVTGLTDGNLKQSKIYPNPADQRFIIEDANGAELSVFNVKGELMINLKVMNENQEVNISQLSRGIYVLKIQMNGMIRTEKLLVN